MMTRTTPDTEVRPDVLVVIPASMLPLSDTWSRFSSGLPDRSALFVVPDKNEVLKSSMRKVAFALRRQGWRIAAVHSSGNGCE